MWKILLSSISGVYLYLIVGAVFGYASYSWTSDYYTAKINHASLLAEKEKDDIQRKGDQLVADYVKQVDKLGSVSSALQKQISSAVRPSTNSTCGLTSGFVRLYNASAVGEASSPSDTDGTPAFADVDTILSIAIENNTKYNKVAQQLIDLQNFNK